MFLIDSAFGTIKDKSDGPMEVSEDFEGAIAP